MLTVVVLYKSNNERQNLILHKSKNGPIYAMLCELVHLPSLMPVLHSHVLRMHSVHSCAG